MSIRNRRRIAVRLASGAAAFCALLACVPPTTTRQRAADSIPDSQPASVRPPASEPIAIGHAEQPDWAACALPADLREPDWPVRLEQLSEHEPHPPGPETIGIAVLPDTQYYASCNSSHFLRQSEWLATQIQQRRLVAALHLGDLTEHNTPEEWRFVQRSLAPIADRLPLVLLTGNHDYGDAGTSDVRQTLFQQFFQNPGRPTLGAVVEMMKSDDLENAYYRLRLPKVELSVLALEWSPRKETVAWAKSVLQQHPDDRVIFMTHAYAYYDGTRYDWKAKGEEQRWNVYAYGTGRKDFDRPLSEDNLDLEGVYDGQMLWDELLKDHQGVFLTLNGHVLADGAAVLTSTGARGNKVHQVLANYQMLDEGGLGYLRLMEFLPDGQTLRMKTYSPSLERYSLADDQNFDLVIDPPLW